MAKQSIVFTTGIADTLYSGGQKINENFELVKDDFSNLSGRADKAEWWGKGAVWVGGIVVTFITLFGTFFIKPTFEKIISDTNDAYFFKDSSLTELNPKLEEAVINAVIESKDFNSIKDKVDTINSLIIVK